MVKRYDFALHGDSHGPYIEREEAKYGVHVEFTDYETVERERDALREALGNLLQECQRSFDWQYDPEFATAYNAAFEVHAKEST